MSTARLEEINASDITLGDWQTEPESLSALDAILSEHSNLWTIRHEVCGELIHPAYGQQEKSLRIDRVLLPKKAFTDSGWRHGAIGFECKKSGEKIGPPIAQSADYARSLFKLETGLKIWLDMVFVWPMAPQHGPLASALYQQRVGSAYSYKWAKLKLKLGEVGVLHVDPDGSIGFGNSPTARRIGSR